MGLPVPEWDPTEGRRWVLYTHPDGPCPDPELCGYTTDQWVEEPINMPGWLGIDCGGCWAHLVPAEEPEP